MWTQFPPDLRLTHTHTWSRAHSAESLLRCKWFVPAHRWPKAALSPPLPSVCSFLTLSVKAPPWSPLLFSALLHSPHCSFHFLDPQFLLSHSFPPLPQPRGPHLHILMNEYSRRIVLSQPRPCFDNSSFYTFVTRAQLMAETESWKPCSYQKEHVNGKAIKPTSD